MKTIQVFSSKAQGFRPISINPKISNNLYNPLNSFQTDGYKKCSESKYVNLRMPTGCGKSWLIKALIYNKLKNDPLTKAIIAVPKLDIGNGFTDEKSNKIILPDGSKMDFRPTHNLCEDGNDSVITKIVNFLKNEIDPGHINSRCLITTHQALATVFDYIKEKNELNLLQNLILWIDEGHHVQLDELEELGIELGNKLGELVSYLLNNVSTASINFATATFWRGDRKRIIPSKFKDIFTNYVVPIDQYLDFVGISITYNYIISNEPYEKIAENLCLQNDCPSIWFLPKVQSRYEKCDKNTQTQKIITAIKCSSLNANDEHIVELITEEKRRIRFENINNTTKHLVALDMFKEGSNHSPLARATLFGPRSMVGENLQILGRLLRKNPNKNCVEMNTILPFELNQLDKEKYQEELNSWQNYLLAAQLMDDFINPVELSIPKDKKNSNGEFIRSKGYLREVCQDDATYQEFLDEITERAIMLAAELETDTKEIVELFKDRLPEIVLEVLQELEIDADEMIVSEYLFKLWNRRSFQMKGFDTSLIDLELVDEKNHPLSWMLYGTTGIGGKTFRDISNVFRNRVYLTFEQVKKIIHPLKLKSQPEWVSWWRNNRPENIPGHPDRIYKNKGWIDLADFLGSNNMRKYNGFISFEDFKVFAKTLGLKSHEEWQKYAKSGKRPNNIYANPEKAYKEFTNWTDVLGIEPYGCQRSDNFMSLNDAQNLMINNNITNQTELIKFLHSNKRPSNFPSEPTITYKVSLGEFLGTGRIASNKIEYHPYLDARNIIRKLKFSGKEAYQKWHTTNKPDKIPYKPERTYKNKGWIGWRDWLGN